MTGWVEEKTKPLTTKDTKEHGGKPKGSEKGREKANSHRVGTERRRRAGSL
jgi:hypothetical protein